MHRTTTRWRTPTVGRRFSTTGSRTGNGSPWPLTSFRADVYWTFWSVFFFLFVFISHFCWCFSQSEMAVNHMMSYLSGPPPPDSLPPHKVVQRTAPPSWGPLKSQVSEWRWIDHSTNANSICTVDGEGRPWDTMCKWTIGRRAWLLGLLVDDKELVSFYFIWLFISVAVGGRGGHWVDGGYVKVSVFENQSCFHRTWLEKHIFMTNCAVCEFCVPWGGGRRGEGGRKNFCKGMVGFFLYQVLYQEVLKLWPLASLSWFPAILTADHGICKFCTMFLLLLLNVSSSSLCDDFTHHQNAAAARSLRTAAATVYRVNVVIMNV